MSPIDAPVIDFGLGAPGPGSVGLRKIGEQQYIGYGDDVLISVDEIKIVGQHNIVNVMAATALTLAVGIGHEPIRSAIREFGGLPHRCQWVANFDGVEFFNDSKGTNVGATIAAIEGLGARLNGRIVLIAGGVGKGADFSGLAPVIERWVRAVVLIGQDAMKIAEHIQKGTELTYADSMPAAVTLAMRQAQPGDAVLLSPACASFDMFDNFQHRGFSFIQAVEELQ
jgi:UDP-N-acetylmuramoylalanine--D-glutamate ligase